MFTPISKTVLVPNRERKLLLVDHAERTSIRFSFLKILQISGYARSSKEAVIRKIWLNRTRYEIGMMFAFALNTSILSVANLPSGPCCGLETHGRLQRTVSGWA